ncbi:hypothetical protein CF392_00265 [Tamilnaduibacter salinus]|uniref:DUF3987 domain-containing protein n=1 Tax=Tamilnaduibacter salinus TaxID=1484056 RepID=A0A2A2I8Z3_9GAMM|nr:YfjI family protein [Tamilnaduibacter salinus]PAV27533.1 hypothetical protein CF392_00265 [Tamilnaduibacter salinus]
MDNTAMQNNPGHLVEPETPQPGDGLIIHDDQPIPLAERPESPAYPVEALGNVLGEAAKSLSREIQTPLGMAGQSVLAAASLAVQGQRDVSRGRIGAGPVSLFCLTIAESGERKSTLDKLALKPIREYEAELRERNHDEWIEYRAARDAWKEQRKSVESQGKSESKSMDSNQRDRLAARLAEVDADEPAPPKRPTLTFDEPTAEGVWRHLQEGQPIAGLFSDEGAGFFGGHGMNEDNRARTITMLSRLWDGSTITRTRGTAGESGQLTNRRLSAHLMMQPVIAAQIMADPVLMKQGFLARFLVSQEPPRVGHRFLGDGDLSGKPGDDPAIRRYWDTLSRLICQRLPLDESDQLEPALMTMDREARDAWQSLHNAIEEQLRPDGAYHDVKEFASKAAENAARIAAILACVEGAEELREGHVERAGELIGYYLESMRVRTEEASQSADEYKARDLLNWINEHGGQLTAEQFKQLPSPMRKAAEARRLLSLLVAHGYVTVIRQSAQGKPSAWQIREVSHGV